MAIDTENKRRSTHGIWAVCRILPVPDNSMTIEDRWHLWLYRGLAAVGSGGAAAYRSLISPTHVTKLIDLT